MNELSCIVLRKLQRTRKGFITIGGFIDRVRLGTQRSRFKKGLDLNAQSSFL